MEKGIRISQKHGVNPTMGVCYFCGEDDGTIGLLGRLPDDAEAPRRMVLSTEPCAKCKAATVDRVMLIEVRGDLRYWPERTGRAAFMLDAAVRRFISDESMLADVLRKRFAFVEEAAFRKLVVEPEPI